MSANSGSRSPTGSSRHNRHSSTSVIAHAVTTGLVIEATRTIESTAIGTLAEAGQLSASYLELGRRIWSDLVFRAKWQDRGAPLIEAVQASLIAAIDAGHARTDMSFEALSAYALVVLDGLLLRIRIGMLPDELTDVIALYEQTIRGDPTTAASSADRAASG